MMPGSLRSRYAQAKNTGKGSHTLIGRIDGVIALSPGALNKFSVDEQLVGTLDLHIIGLNDNLVIERICREKERKKERENRTTLSLVAMVLTAIRWG